jgi:predicted PurR-regulated permease PerM
MQRGDDLMEETRPPTSPRWGATTKLVVAFTFVAIAAALLIRFHTIIGPLLMAFIFSYLLHPVASFLSRSARLSWRASVGIVFLLILIFLLGLLTLGGVGLVNQIQSLITFVQSSLEELPTIIENVAAWGAKFGLDLSHIDLSSISNQALSFGQSLLGQMGSLLSTLAGSAASFLGWTLFVLVISFFVLAESGGLRQDILKVELPGYSEDLRRLGQELARIWNAFLRGQIIIFFITVAIYFVVLSLLGVRYSIGLALAAGFARFVPYVGPAINWTMLALVTFFQPFKLFGMDPLYYTLLVFFIALFIDQVFDNIVSPRIMADALRVHPAAVLVAAIISASLLGVLGVVVAAPMLATLQLFGQYMLRKMLDLNPWPPQEARPPSPPRARPLVRLRAWWRSIRRNPR